MKDRGPSSQAKGVSVSIMLLYSLGCGQSRSYVWEKINSGAVKVRPEERIMSLRQSTESQHSACQPSPSITHAVLLLYTNKQHAKGH